MQISQFLIRQICVNGKLLKWVLSCVFAICIPDAVACGQQLERWVYAPVNFLVPAEVDRLDKLMRNAKSLGYTHFLITDSKFCRLHELDKKYFAHIERIKGLAFPGWLFEQSSFSERESGGGTACSRRVV